MKTSLPLLLFLLCLASVCNAQAYHPFLVEGAHWRITERYCDGNCDPALPYPIACIVVNQYAFKLVRDSSLAPDEMYLIENKLTTATTPSGNQPCSSYYAQQGHSYTACFSKGILREDTVARKVYWKYGSGFGTNDSIFLDFSKNAGDTLKFVSRDFTRVLNTFYVVDSIFTSPRVYSLTNVKTWALRPLTSPVNEMYLYESVGMNVGFWGYQRFEGDYSTSLYNYCIGSDSICGFSCVDPLLGVNDLSGAGSVSLYPNPVKEQITLTVESQQGGTDLRFVITDLLGKAVISETVNKGQTLINISSLVPSIYILRVLSDGQVIYANKFVHE